MLIFDRGHGEDPPALVLIPPSAGLHGSGDVRTGTGGQPGTGEAQLRHPARERRTTHDMGGQLHRAAMLDVTDIGRNPHGPEFGAGLVGAVVVRARGADRVAADQLPVRRLPRRTGVRSRLGLPRAKTLVRHASHRGRPGSALCSIPMWTRTCENNFFEYLRFLGLPNPQAAPGPGPDHGRRSRRTHQDIRAVSPELLRLVQIAPRSTAGTSRSRAGPS